MRFAPGTSLAVVAALLLAGPPVDAQTAPAGTAPDRSSSPWSTGTNPPPKPADNADDSTLSLRVYDGVNSGNLPPYRPRRPDDPAYAVDVSAIMGRCPDGSLVITALLIGGHFTPLDSRCSAITKREDARPAPPCDANRWNCATTPPE